MTRGRFGVGVDSGPMRAVSVGKSTVVSALGVGKVYHPMPRPVSFCVRGCPVMGSVPGKRKSPVPRLPLEASMMRTCQPYRATVFEDRLKGICRQMGREAAIMTWPVFFALGS